MPNNDHADESRVDPDLAAFLTHEAGTGRGAVSRYVEGLIRAKEIETRIL